MTARKTFWHIFLGIFFFSLCPSAFADLVISEVHPTQEFVEIWNNGTENVACETWKISEETSLGTENFIFFPAKSVCEAGNFLVIPLSRKINDTGDTVRLYNENAEKVDEVFVPAKVEGKSFSRKANGTFFWTESSEGMETPLPSVYSAVLQFSEMVPNPMGTDTEGEFFEIHNTSDVPLNVKNWSVKDASGKTFSFPHREISAGGFLAFFFSETGITLNNDTETLQLFDPNGEQKDEISFSENIPEGSSFSRFEGNFLWTQSPTPQNENILLPIAVSSTSSGSSSPLLFSEKFFDIATIRQKNPVLKIVRIGVSEKNDFVEIFCEECNMDLEGIRLGLDDEIFRIPKETFVKTGETLQFVFEKETQKKPEKTEDGWTFFVPESGITATDETVFVGNEKSEILDAVCFANGNGSFSSGEKTDLGLLHFFGEWHTPNLAEYECISSKNVEKGVVFQRFLDEKNSEKWRDTNTKDDFFLGSLEKKDLNVARTPQKIFLDSVQFEEKTVVFTFLAEENVNPTGFFLEHNGKRLVSIFENMEISASKQLFVIVPRNKVDPEKMIIMWKDGQGNVVDGFCFQFSRDFEKTLGNDLVTLHHWGVWASPLASSCISVPQYANFLLQKNEKIFPLKAEFFEISEILGVPKEKTKNFFSEKPKIYEIFWEGKAGNLVFSGKVFPKTLLRFRIGEKIFSKQTGETGKFSFSFPEKISTPQQKLTFWVGKEKFHTQIFTPFSLTSAHNFVWQQVLPNPKGKDAGNEKAVAQVLHGGWLQNVVLSNGKSTKKIPFRFVESEEMLTFSGNILPSLKNSKSGLFVQEKTGKKLAEIFWNKARENEFFGISAPQFFEKVKKKMTKNKKGSVKEKTEKKKLSEFLETVVQIFRMEDDGVWLLEKEKLFFLPFSSAHQTYPFFFFPEETVTLRKNLKQGTWELQRIFPDHVFFQKKEENFFLLFFSSHMPFFFFFLGMVMIPFLMFRKKKLSF